MYKRIKITLFLAVFFCVPISAQTIDRNKPSEDPQTLKKQIIADDLENQAKNVPLAAVRVLVKYKIAWWLWKKGKDGTGRASPLAVRALEDLYENKAEIPDLYFDGLSRDIFSLLDSNEKETATRLSAKYNLTSEDKLKSAEALLNQTGGEKIVTDKVLESLNSSAELNPMTVWLMEELRSRHSPELLRILARILTLEESGINSFTDGTLFHTVDFFRSERVSNEFRSRFYRIVVNRARNSIQTPGTNITETYDLLGAILGDIIRNEPDMSPDARSLMAALSTRLPSDITRRRVVYDRIEEAADRLSAMISEADAADDAGIRNDLLTEASQLALKKGKFVLAVDLSEKVRANKKEKAKNSPTFDRWYDQFLGEVSDGALKKGEIDSAKYAVRLIVDKISLAENLRKRAAWYIDKQNPVMAGESLDDALKLLTNADNDLRKINGLIRLIPTAIKINPSVLSEITNKTANAINAMPTLKTDNKPGTEGYKQYVSTTMAVNYNLLPAVRDLANKNSSAAEDFVSRINRKEIRIVADYVLLTDPAKLEGSQTAALSGK